MWDSQFRNAPTAFNVNSNMLQIKGQSLGVATVKTKLCYRKFKRFIGPNERAIRYERRKIGCG